MFSLLGPGVDRTCQGVSRRELLRVGALGAGLLGLPTVLAAKAHAVEAERSASSADHGGPSYVRDKSVVLLFLSGGPPHIEFFDPKMTAPAEFRSITGETPTSLPGVTFGGTFPRLAALAQRIAIVRNYGSHNAGHTYEKVATGNNPTKAAMGALFARIAGGNNVHTGMPNNILVKPEGLRDGLKLDTNFETGALPTLTDPGALGPAYAAFDSSGGGPLQENMRLKLELSRLADRRALLDQLDGVRRVADSSPQFAGLDKYRQQAFEIITRGIAQAFDLSREDPRTLARYDTTGLFAAAELQRYYDMRRATNLLGHQMLLARRLCEAGCGFVTVSDCGWDYHANGNSPKGMAGIWPMGGQVDHAVAAFLEDIHERGLSERILLIVTGEMGRTPRINNNGGRDHYGELTPLLIAGGGLRMGQVIGQSDASASRPVGESYDPRHLFGTVMHSLFDVAALRLDRSAPGDVARAITSSEPIPLL